MVNLRSLRKLKQNYCLQTFLWALGLSFLFFLPWIIFNHGYFFFYGDFNVQQIPFYQMIHDSIQHGNIGWSYTTDLGANIIGSYSFYMLGSPFFWLTMLFPSDAVPYMIAPMLMLKFAFAALCAYLFMRRYVKEQRFAMFGAILYAFSGFGIYNIFFNHFHEAMITFPLMLATLDMLIYDKRKGVFAASVFLAAAVNYYFFAGQVIFIILYWIFRMATRSYRMSIVEFIRLAFEAVTGFLAAGIIVVPAIFAILQNDRLNNYPHGWGAIVYTSEQRYVHILESFFFPPDMPAYANFTPDSNAKWGSVAGWLPLFSMVGVFTFSSLKTNKWLKKLIPILFIIALVPIFNSIFQLMNFSYYARWYYMLTLMLSMATVLCLDREDTDYKPALIRTFLITLTICLLIGFIPEDAWDDAGSKHELGLEKYSDRFWVWCAIAFIGLAALVIVLTLRRNKKWFIRITAIVLSVLIVGYSTVLIGVGVTNASYKYDHIYGDAIQTRGKFNKELPDLTSVRSDFYEEMDNLGMYWQIPNIQAFQSIVPGSVMNFYNSVGVERNVASRPETKVYAIRSLLSVKYLFDYNDDHKDFRGSDGNTVMTGWKQLMDKYDYTVYENLNYIPYGFVYDEYITQTEYYRVSEDDRHLLLMKVLVVPDDEVRRVRGILKHHKNVSDILYTESEFINDCRERSKLVCSDVKFEDNRFTAKFACDMTDRYVFFSVPYEDGWSATVNGEPADILNVNIGFMAVRVPGNQTSDIVFEYHTPGVGIGAAVTGAAVVLLVVYMILWKEPIRRRKSVAGYYAEDDEEIHDIDPFAEDADEAEVQSEEAVPAEEPQTEEQPEEAAAEDTEQSDDVVPTEEAAAKDEVQSDDAVPAEKPQKKEPQLEKNQRKKMDK